MPEEGMGATGIWNGTGFQPSQVAETQLVGAAAVDGGIGEAGAVRGEGEGFAAGGAFKGETGGWADSEGKGRRGKALSVLACAGPKVGGGG